MKIKRMTAVFGCLNGTTLELHDGLNIITAPNGSGKSTWCAFIESMLYGIDSSRREKGGVKPDKVKYAPWSGALMSGEMELEHGGRAVTIVRSSASAASPFRRFAALRTGSAEPVDALTGANAGQELTGMPRAVFESSVFIRQGGHAVTANAELEKRINSIVSAGDEDVSYTEAEARLRAWQRLRYHNRAVGAIPEIDAKIAALTERIDNLDAAGRERAELAARLERAEERERKLNEAAERDRARLRRERGERLAAGRGAAERAQAELTSAAAEAEALKARLDAAGGAGGASPEEQEAAARADMERAAAQAVKLPPAAVIAAAAVWFAAVIALGLTLSPWLLALELLLAVPIVYLAGIKSRRQRAAEAVLTARGVRSLEELRREAEERQTLENKYSAALERTEQARAASERARQAQTEAENAALAAEGDAETKRLMSELAAAGAECAALRERLAALGGRFDATGDPLVLGSELMALRSRRTELKAQYDAIAEALDVLGEADSELRERFSPRLGRRTSEIMSELTGGRYDRLLFDRELNARARESGQIDDHEAAYLSRGTLDQLYLALRLAVCELALPEGEPCPLVLDDALSAFDDTHCAAALSVLNKIAEKRQVLLFTCQSREAEIYREMCGKEK
ncbi:MAG: AAA family ATPase [Oscillospiraceae bacterium]|nr:AAA family ATPase [Oscillospiraceae bacterium]